MIRKKKICKGRGKFIGYGCGESRFIFGYGLCQFCYQRANFKPLPVGANYKKRPSLKFRPTIQDEKELKQSDTFLLAWNYWQGKFFIGSGSVTLENLLAWNCMHVLDKKNYPYFKYYYRNIVLGSREQHRIIDQGTDDDLKLRLSNTKESQAMWDSFFAYREKLLKEYQLWVAENHAIYKLG